jgi:adenylate cyclase
LSTNSPRRRRAYLLAAIGSLCVIQLIFQLSGTLLKAWNSQVFDRFFVLRSSIGALRPAYDGSVVHVDLNDTAIRQLGTYYPTRAQYAKVISNLAAMGVSAQAYDLIFAAETDRTDDQALIQATRKAGDVYFGMALGLGAPGAGSPAREPPAVRDYLDRTRWTVKVDGNDHEFYTGTQPIITFPSLASGSRGIGFISLKTDPDGVLRRVPLLVRCAGGFYPSLPFRLICDYLGVGPDKILISPGRCIRLKNARFPGRAPRDLLIPIDGHGRMIINFIGPWGTMRHYNFAQVLSASEDRDTFAMWKKELSGKIAVVSDVSTGATDLGAVPVDIDFPLSGLHANVIQTILSGNFLSDMSPALTAAIEIAMVALVFIFSICFSPIFFAGGTIVLTACYAATAFGFFLYGGLMFDIIRPVICAACAAAVIGVLRYSRDAKEREAMRRSFESYFAPQVVKKILADPARLNKGQRKELTILFSDIKDFTAHSSSYSPDRIRGFLNEYFETMVEIVFAHTGTVDKYIGDGLMVFFGDPEPVPDHALRSVRAAIEMQKRARELTAKWAKEGGFPLHVRIGINTGEVVVGNMGSSRRLSYTVLGSAVNLAKRLESSAPVDGILISRKTRDLVAPEVSTRFFGEILVKGIDTPVQAYIVSGE